MPQPLGREPDDRHDHQRAAPELGGDEVLDDERDPFTGRRRSTRRRLVRKDLDPRRRDPQAGQDPGRVAVRIGGGRVDQPGVVGRRTARRSDGDEPVAHHRLADQFVAELGAEGDVGESFGDERGHLVGGGGAEADFDVRLAGGEGLEQRRSHRLGEGRGGHHPQQLRRTL